MKMAEFTDLILLVGTNPLPNYVVAKYFIDNNDQLQNIWLIHSEENKAIGQSSTLKIAEYIRDRVSDPTKEFILVALSNVTSAWQIGKDLSNKMCNKISRDAKLHLNYTGGTKTMAVHVYQKLKEQFNGRISFSYLDARSFRLIEDDQEVLSEDLRKKVHINIEELFKLHGFKRVAEKRTAHEMDSMEVLHRIEELINQGKLDTLLSWKEDFIRKKFYNNKSDFNETPRSFLRNNQLLTNDNQINMNEVNALRESFKEKTLPLPEVIEILRLFPEQSILEENGNLWIPTPETTNNVYEKRVKPIRDFLDGKWLEHYVFEVLNEAISQDSVLKTEYNRGWISLKHNWKIEKEDTKDFELDVMLLYGYQLCGISCTTFQNARACKLKGFEIIHRIKQIGGDEGRMVLVTCLPDEEKEQFCQDLLTFTGSERENLLVLTKGDLKRRSLWTKVRQHVWGD